MIVPQRARPERRITRRVARGERACHPEVVKDHGMEPGPHSSRVPTHREGAIWAAPAITANGDIYLSTGNGDSNDAFEMANAVVHLSRDLQQVDYYAPSDWASLSSRDADVGSTGPTMLDTGQVLQVGKRGDGYLLQADHLGQIGGEVFQASVCSGAYGEAAHSGGPSTCRVATGSPRFRLRGSRSLSRGTGRSSMQARRPSPTRLSGPWTTARRRCTGSIRRTAQRSGKRQRSPSAIRHIS